MFGTYQRLNVSIWASDRAVIKAARTKIDKSHRKGLQMRSQRKVFYRSMLYYHHKAQELANTFRL